MNRLLILNLSIDSKNTSLAFTQDWINSLSKKYDYIDVLTLRLGKEFTVNENVAIQFVNKHNEKKSKIFQLFRLIKLSRTIVNQNDYSHCFAHMAPMQHLVIKPFLFRKKIKSTLWFTHSGPRFGLKWIILLLSSFVADNLVTASKNSFPFRFKKRQSIGHGIDTKSFFNKREDFKLKKIIVLSRISKSKNIDETLGSLLLTDNFNNLIIDVVGGPLNQKDMEYLDYLKSKYSEFPNISFLGRKLHSELPELLKKYDININNAKEGFFDKSVLETVSSGLLNFYRSSDFDFLYSIKYVKYLKFNDQNLHLKINNLQKVDSKEVLLEIKNSQNYAKEHSLENITNKLYTIFN